jgi:leader peptidase (prepilin peptidase) / N-methyltransferase
MLNYMVIAINAAVLIYGGVVDYKKREIPNAVPIVLLGSGLLNFSFPGSIIGLAVPLLLLIVSEKISKSEVPGGDFKLLCALGFSCGLPELIAVLFLTCVFTLLYSAVRRLPLKRSIPLCSYIAPAYIVSQALVLVLITFKIQEVFV